MRSRLFLLTVSSCLSLAACSIGDTVQRAAGTSETTVETPARASTPVAAKSAPRPKFDEAKARKAFHKLALEGFGMAEDLYGVLELPPTTEELSLTTQNVFCDEMLVLPTRDEQRSRWATYLTAQANDKKTGADAAAQEDRIKRWVVGGVVEKNGDRFEGVPKALDRLADADAYIMEKFSVNRAAYCPPA